MKKYLTVSVALSLALIPPLKGVDAKNVSNQPSKKFSLVDKDKNQIPDDWQKKYKLGFGKNVASTDKDKDGLNNLLEYQLNLNPVLKDSDKDKLSDGQEDNDRDGLINLQEIQAKLSPVSSDTDKDGIRDDKEDNDKDGLKTAEEFVVRTNPVLSDTNKNSIIDGQEDKDRDGVSNEIEFEFHGNPNNSDSDHDGVQDSNEDFDHDGVINQNELVELKIHLINDTDKRLYINFENHRGNQNFEVKDEIGVGDVKVLLKKLTITSQTTKVEAIQQIKEVFGIKNVKKISFQAEFGNGKNEEFQDQQNDDGEDHNHHGGQVNDH